MSRVIVALSGGKASAWCADWAFRNYSKSEIVLYFNDTKWEHPDLYRFLHDLSRHFDHPITEDSDGRSPEQLFYYNSALANNRMPFCSKTLKAKRLQKFYQDGDVLVFGIGAGEPRRAQRIVEVYQHTAVKTGKWPVVRLPLVEENVLPCKLDEFLVEAKIEVPLLYRFGFTHNNCSGGCVRAGKRQWKLLYEKLPAVYAERERVEREVRACFDKDISFFKDETLEEFRHRIERGELSSVYGEPENEEQECIGICESQS
jgi:hypothetical protein